LKIGRLKDPRTLQKEAAAELAAVSLGMSSAQ
jgi:hypothetical protein